MTPKQERFVQEYMLDLNATQAAIRAGYSAHTADVQGPRLLGNVGVAAAIQAAQVEFRERMEVSKESVTAQLNTAYDMADPDAKMAAKFAYMARRYPDLFGELKLLMGRVFLATKATFDEVKADTTHVWRGAAEKFERDRAARSWFQSARRNGAALRPIWRKIFRPMRPWKPTFSSTTRANGW